MSAAQQIIPFVNVSGEDIPGGGVLEPAGGFDILGRIRMRKCTHDSSTNVMFNSPMPVAGSSSGLPDEEKTGGYCRPAWPLTAAAIHADDAAAVSNGLTCGPRAGDWYLRPSGRGFRWVGADLGGIAQAAPDPSADRVRTVRITGADDAYPGLWPGVLLPFEGYVGGATVWTDAAEQVWVVAPPGYVGDLATGPYPVCAWAGGTWNGLAIYVATVSGGGGSSLTTGNTSTAATGSTADATTTQLRAVGPELGISGDGGIRTIQVLASGYTKSITYLENVCLAITKNEDGLVTDVVLTKQTRTATMLAGTTVADAVCAESTNGDCCVYTVSCECSEEATDITIPLIPLYVHFRKMNGINVDSIVTVYPMTRSVVTPPYYTWLAPVYYPFFVSNMQFGISGGCIEIVFQKLDSGTPGTDGSVTSTPATPWETVEGDSTIYYKPASVQCESKTAFANNADDVDEMVATVVMQKFNNSISGTPLASGSFEIWISSSPTFTDVDPIPELTGYLGSFRFQMALDAGKIFTDSGATTVAVDGDGVYVVKDPDSSAVMTAVDGAHLAILRTGGADGAYLDFTGDAAIGYTTNVVLSGDATMVLRASQNSSISGTSTRIIQSADHNCLVSLVRASVPVYAEGAIATATPSTDSLIHTVTISHLSSAAWDERVDGTAQTTAGGASNWGTVCFSAAGAYPGEAALAKVYGASFFSSQLTDPDKVTAEAGT